MYLTQIAPTCTVHHIAVTAHQVSVFKLCQLTVLGQVNIRFGCVFFICSSWSDVEIPEFRKKVQLGKKKKALVLYLNKARYGWKNIESAYLLTQNLQILENSLLFKLFQIF
jgi:hypothetical protein